MSITIDNGSIMKDDSFISFPRDNGSAPAAMISGYDSDDVLRLVPVSDTGMLQIETTPAGKLFATAGVTLTDGFTSDTERILDTAGCGSKTLVILAAAAGLTVRAYGSVDGASNYDVALINGVTGTAVASGDMLVFEDATPFTHIKIEAKNTTPAGLTGTSAVMTTRGYAIGA